MGRADLATRAHDGAMGATLLLCQPPRSSAGASTWGVEDLVLHYEVLHPGFVALTPQREGDAPAEPDVLTTARLGGSLALPTLRLKQKR